MDKQEKKNKAILLINKHREASKQLGQITLLSEQLTSIGYSSVEEADAKRLPFIKEVNDTEDQLLDLILEILG